MRDRTSRPASFGLAGTTLIAAVPATGIVCSIEDLTRPECSPGLRITSIRVLALMTPATLLIHFIAVQRVKLNGAAARDEATGMDRSSRHRHVQR